MKRPYYLSLAPYLSWREVEHPYRWEKRFGRPGEGVDAARRPLEVEIGFGNGAALVERAAADPGTAFIGIEVSWESVKRALRRVARGRLENVAVVRGEAWPVVERMFAPRSIGRVVSLFPCPWPKERHAAHRLFSRPFLRILNSRMSEGAEAQIVTDFPPYRDWLIEQVGGTGFACRTAEIPPRFDTKYERKWSERGQERFHEIVLEKEEHVAIPSRKGVEMKVHHLDRFDPDRFNPKGITGPATVQFKQFLFDPAREKGMARVFVGEEGFHQEFWIEIARAGDRWKIRPAGGCAFIPTAGAQRALDLVREGAAG